MAVSARFRRTVRVISKYLPPFNFITAHYLYFLGTCLFSAIVFWGSSTPHGNVSFTDALFLCISAMTEAGLNTINLSTLNTFQQVIIFVLMVMGSAIFVSAFVVEERHRAFERRFREVIEEDRRLKQTRSTSRSQILIPTIFRPATSQDMGEPISNGQSTPPSNDNQEPVRGVNFVSSPFEKPTEESELKKEDEQQKEETQMNSNGPRQRKPSKEVDIPEAQQGESSGDSVAPDVQIPQEAEKPKIVFAPDIKPPFGVGALRPPKKENSIYKGIGAQFSHFHLGHTRSLDESQEDSRFSSQGVFTEQGELTLPPSPYLGRNSNLHPLDYLERLRLGGVEYRALRILAFVVPTYFVLWQLLGCLGLGAWVLANDPDAARSNGLNPFWAGAFLCVSAFNNNGYSLIDANMTAFQTADYMLITMGLLILAGNTAYPVFLRFIIWTFWKLTPKGWKEERQALKFLLDHPRRCYTNLFPSNDTWWLLFAVILLNGTDWASFLILNIGNQALSYLSLHTRVLDGLFQAFAVRSGGFYVVPISSLRIGTQILYVIMMYISAFPVAITMRSSNVYEERSLGIYAEDIAKDPASRQRARGGTATGLLDTFRRRISSIRQGDERKPIGAKAYFVQQQLRAQLAHDLWWVVLAVLFIMIIETSQFESNPAEFSVFNVIFEVVSGYGCVGISIGVPWAEYSFCGSWHVLSKLVLCWVMLVGRHRGLPVVIDMAVLLPGEWLDKAEAEDARIRLGRRLSKSGEIG